MAGAPEPLTAADRLCMAAGYALIAGLGWMVVTGDSSPAVYLGLLALACWGLGEMLGPRR